VSSATVAPAPRIGFRERGPRYPCRVTHASQYVFGYGSLLERPRGRDGGTEAPAGPWPAELRRYRRTWNVAMENSRTIPGYKYYVDEATGKRGDWFVTFLNVVPDPGSAVNGVVFAVTDEVLVELDGRERNYDRVEVSGQLSPAMDGRAWVYVGSAAAVQRFEDGYRAGRAVVPRRYYQRVIDDFAAMGQSALRTFEQLTDPPPCPVVDLRRVDLPLGQAAAEQLVADAAEAETEGHEPGTRPAVP
jgi:cation transport regulator ChaC